MPIVNVAEELVKIVDRAVGKCSEDINGNAIYNDEKVCSSCTTYLALLVNFFLISICISSAFIYFHWYLNRTGTETVIS